MYKRVLGLGVIYCADTRSVSIKAKQQIMTSKVIALMTLTRKVRRDSKRNHNILRNIY